MLVSFILLLSAATGQPAGAVDEDPGSFQFEQYADLEDAERAEKIGADLKESFPPGVPLSRVVSHLQKSEANCNWHNRTGETSRYICKHERKLGAFKSQTTTVYILFNSDTCAVTDYKVGTGTKFGFGSGKFVPREKDPAAHCFKDADG